ncbi:adenosylcobinamide kinase /adenosylcobinamide-phosphate guanylyltransferase [Roseivivax marinus]|uniref:bifunctional adenosylcobinamide kinase/adenosylcobinamide-phosphate guanylyltransferase n=1 Tax=Roseivivax marinus TaxID=1379903 RepID=UPI0008C475BB|nr:bifunctional adenosylcobinamide kinase/adenosylcobinamide-phosphate guanylyltransferase [Roseivivax marinus]SEL88423.1 adenosylcobinamide kinase /adenosylcobinamide-phosphate guanylyltransferase [Roseivivax marinus]
MGKSILITGGARSGKSAFAETATLAMGSKAVYIATAEAQDPEMAERIARHQARRGPEWRTISAPLDLAGALRNSDGDVPRLVDCLTLWLSNLILTDCDWEPAAQELAETIAAQRASLVIVTNEVGAGIVPENALARRYRDAAGLLNQRVAAVCDEVQLCVAGYPIKVKPR